MDSLRKRVKLLKALQKVSYKELAEYIEMSPKSFYNWINGQYEFGDERKKRLKFIIDTLQEEQEQ